LENLDFSVVEYNGGGYSKLSILNLIKTNQISLT
jgi:hypothetical protein